MEHLCDTLPVDQCEPCREAILQEVVEAVKQRRTAQQDAKRFLALQDRKIYEANQRYGVSERVLARALGLKSRSHIQTMLKRAKGEHAYVPQSYYERRDRERDRRLREEGMLE